MKKLMTMISAVAVAFGLQAAAPYPSGSHFNEENWLGSDDAKMWTSLEGLSISTEPATFLDPVGYPAQFADEELANNLAFKRGLTDPTYRAIALKDGAPVKQTIGADGVVVDTLIKFTPYDGDDQANIDGTNAKVAVWVKEVEGADGAASTYQLMVTAGQYVNENLVRKDYACSSKITDMDAWYRLTVKAIPDVTQGGQIPGFVVLINGETVTSGEVKKDLTGVSLPLSTEASVWNVTGAIFPALVSNDQTLQQVGFAGQGWIDDLSITDEIPEFVKTVETFTITGGDHVESFRYNGNQWKKGNAPMIVTGVAPGTEGEVTDIVYEEGYFGPSTDKVLKNANKENVVGKAQKLVATVTIGDVATSYATINDAVAAINAATSDVTLKLASAVTADIVVENASAEGVITLDLAGQTLTGKTNTGNSYAIYLKSGKLIVTDTSVDQTGRVVGNVSSEGGDITLAAGIYDGAVYLAGDSQTVTGGKFLANSNFLSDLNGWAAEGLTFVQEGDYFVLGSSAEVVAFSVKLADHVEAKIFIDDILVDGDIPETLTAGQKYKVTFTAANGYQFAADVQTVFEGTAGADAIVIEAPAVTAIAYEITYSWVGVEDADKENIANENPATYTIVDTITFTAPTCEGYTFKGFDIQGIALGETGNKTVTGTFEKSSTPTVVVDPSKEPVVVDSEEAANALTISATSPDASVVPDAEYTGYFKKVVTQTTDGKFSVAAVLDETVVKAEEVAAELVGKFDKITDAGVEVAAKPGLFYSVEQGQTLGAMTEGERVMATGTTVQLKATKYSGSGFYKILVNTSDKK